MKAVAYYRVSTAAQGRSGLGLDAQRAAVAEVCAARGLEMVAEFTEVESGKRADLKSRARDHQRRAPASQAQVGRHS